MIEGLLVLCLMANLFGIKWLRRQVVDMSYVKRELQVLNENGSLVWERVYEIETQVLRNKEAAEARSKLLAEKLAEKGANKLSRPAYFGR